MKNSEKAFENWLFAQPFFDAESYALDSSVYATEKEAWNAAIEALWDRDFVDKLCDRIEELEKTLIKLRDCDWTITLPDRMDAVRDIARAALEGK